MNNNKKGFDPEAAICAIVLVIMLTLCFLGVVSRYVLHFSFSFTEEFTCALFVLLGTVGSALAIKSRSLYTLDLIDGVLNDKQKKIFSIITTVLTIGVAIFLIVCTIPMIKLQIQMKSVTVALRLPAWIYTTAVPFGLVLVVVRGLQNILADIKALKEMNEGGAQK